MPAHPEPDPLMNAARRADLPALVARLYPESGARPGRAGTVRAAWRGDRHPSCSLWRNAEGVWMFKDHATGASGNTFGFLLNLGYSRAEAARLLKDQEGVGDDPRWDRYAVHPGDDPLRERLRPYAGGNDPLPGGRVARGVTGKGHPAVPRERLEAALAAAQKRLRRAGGHPELERRGFPLEAALALGFGVWRGHLLFAVRAAGGELRALKVRRHRPAGGERYFYLFAGLGSPAWHAPGFAAAPRALLVEGELNAAAFHLATGWAAVGVAGAEGQPDWAALRGKRVWATADLDAPGRQALLRWRAQAAAAGVDLRPLPLMPFDACELLGRGQGAWLRAFLGRWAG